MSTFIKSLIHLLAAISLYIIAVVGLGWFWTVGTADNNERINSVLINLSYSFITGYLVYLFTILFPSKRRSKKINYIVAGRLQSIIRDDLNYCLRVFVPIERLTELVSDDELASMYEQGDLRSHYIYSSLAHKESIIDSLCDHCKQVLQVIDSIINDYSHDLSEDTLKLLESIKKDPVHEGCEYAKLVYSLPDYPSSFIMDPPSNKRIFEGFIRIRDSIEEWIKDTQDTKIISHIMKKINLKRINFYSLEDVIDEEEVAKICESQKEEGNWSFFDERLHMEKVFSQRVNFVLLLFPVLIAAFCAAKEASTERLIISIAGFITLLSFYIPLKRTFFKLDILQKITYKIKIGDSVDNNPIKYVENIHKKIPLLKRIPNISSYSLIMWGILIMLIAMFVLIVLTARGIL